MLKSLDLRIRQSQVLHNDEIASDVVIHISKFGVLKLTWLSKHKTKCLITMIKRLSESKVSLIKLAIWALLQILGFWLETYFDKGGILMKLVPRYSSTCSNRKNDFTCTEPSLVFVYSQKPGN